MREAAADLEADVREADLLERSLLDAVFQFGEDAASVAAQVAGRVVTGLVTHATGDVATIVDGSGGTTHVRIDAIVSVRVDEPGQGRTQPRRPDPRSFRAVLAEAQAVGSTVELAGAELLPLRGVVQAVARDHVVIVEGGVTHLVALAAIAVVAARGR